MKNFKNFLLVLAVILIGSFQKSSAQADPYANYALVTNYNAPVGTTGSGGTVIFFGLGNASGAANPIVPNSVEWTINFPSNVLTVGVGTFPAGWYEYSRVQGTSLIVKIRNSVTIPVPTPFIPQDFEISYPVTGTVANVMAQLSWELMPQFGYGAQGDSDPFNNGVVTPIIFSPPVATPVTLTTFSGLLDNNVSNLTWTVWGEYDIANYEVLRSINAIDFVSVGKVTANNSKTYKLADNVAGLGNKFYYKLKINENSKESNYSKVIELRKSADNKITIYPNPTSHVVNISSLIGTETISVLSVDGREIMKQKASEGSNVVNIAKLANGTYSLVITNGEEVTTFKIVKN